MSISAAAWSENQATAGRLARQIGIDAGGRVEALEASVVVVACEAFPEADWEGWEVLRARKSAGKNSAAVCCASEFWTLEQQTMLLLGGANRVLHAAAANFELALRQFFVRCEEDLGRQALAKREMAAAGIIGDSPAMQACFLAAGRAARLSAAPVLISGETGTGKELFARAIHAMDPVRSRKPFQAVNCAALVHTLLESELFGYRRGSFTGADRDRLGWLRAADGGVLFLDEIGEMEAPLQAKLLRVLQNKAVQPLGSEQEIPVDVRVISATNRSLEELVERGAFREDLYHRLNVLRLRIPPLRERAADIAALARHFAAIHSGDGVPAPMTQTFVDALAAARWPGNVRQLENSLRAALLERENGEPLDLSHAPAELWRDLSSAGAAAPKRTVQAETESGELARLLRAAGWNLSGALANCERAMLESALAHVAGNQSKAARLLGLTPRSVYNKLRKYRLGA